MKERTPLIGFLCGRTSVKEKQQKKRNSRKITVGKHKTFLQQEKESIG